MNIPSFDEFLGTIDEKTFSSWVDDVSPINVKVVKSTDESFHIDMNDFMASNLFLSQQMLRSYHEWLSKEIEVQE